MSIRVVIVESLPLIREYMVRICENPLGYEVAGECSDRQEAKGLIARTRPHLVLLDLGMREDDGFCVVESISRETPETRCVLMSMHCTEFMVAQMERSPAVGFIDKNLSGMKELIQALTKIVSGQRYYSATYLEVQQQMRRDPHSFAKILTDREQQVLGLVGCSCSDQEVADALGISLRTAETHRRNLLQKLGVRSTPKLIKYAIERGMTRFAGNPGKLLETQVASSASAGR